MSLLRPSSELSRRSRVKSVVTRRAISSRSSSGRHKSTSDDEDHDDLGAEDDELLSCFLDEPADSGFIDDWVLQVNDDRDVLSDLKENEEEFPSEASERSEVPAPDVYYRDDSDLVQLSPKKTERSKESQDDFKIESHAEEKTEFNIEPKLQKNHVYQTETKMDKIHYKAPIQNDFKDMALSRDTPDIGMDRAEPILTLPQIKARSSLQNGHLRPKKFRPTVQFGWFDFFIGIAAITIFFVDVGTDIELAAHYFRREMWMYGGVTTGLIVWPSLVTTILGLHWYHIDYKKEKEVVEKIKKAKKKAFITPKYVWFLRIFFTLFQMGPVLRIMAYLYYGHMSRNQKLTEQQRNRYYHFMLYEDVDSCLLRLFESFLEAAPQLSWQLYIAMVLKESNDVVGSTFRAIALLSSWGSLAISLVSYHRSLRNSNEDKAKMRWASVPFYFIWRASEIGGRVLCIATFASTFQLWVFAPLLFHWVFMSAWLMAQKTSFYKNTCHEKTFNVVCGYVMIFCFLNLREGVTRYRFVLFYFILYVENFFMLGFWYHFSPDLNEWYHLWGFVVILILFVLHVTFQVLYYYLFHPTKTIKFCLPCDTHLIYESLCYDLESTPVEYEPQLIEIHVPPKIDFDSIINHKHNRDNNVELRVTTV